ncbi:Ibr domain protein (macronuclear) [Tetrahymena thermophila SB210]|uniref:RBR-type E3 ubiquitin transferase n=1 Tax=Tetrahymena thermophila (strain SB210) TaxID=312017 RepID=Q22BP1_TETTS|nr:Ibr domain protein [Tetrahymena thermophila SB210]EAR82688.1 Ibr domain protein [Tetrahymena thermophila SB210]|eukprot:XP_001030351.1 Ibr domain protein [Tetrahymena thermophila SB210]
MVKTQNRKTSIQFPISRSESSSDKNTSFALNFKFSLKCKSENDIITKNQLISQKNSDIIFFSNQEIFIKQKIGSTSNLEFNSNQLIKSQLCINFNDDLKFKDGNEEKFFTFQKQDQLHSKIQGFFQNTDVNFQIGETYLSDSYDTLEAVSQYLNYDYCQETSILQDTHTNKRLECNQQRCSISLNTDSLEESKENLHSSANKIQDAQNDQLLDYQAQDEDDTSSNKSYFSFHPKITKWKVENWSLDPKFEKSNSKQLENVNNEQKKQLESSKTILSKVFKFFTFNNKPKSEQQINVNVGSDDSFYSFSQKKQNQKEGNIIQDEDQSQQFSEDLEWLDYQLGLMRDPNKQNKSQVFELQQVLESNQKITNENSSEQLNIRSKNQQENSFSQINIKTEKIHSDGQNLLVQAPSYNPIENLFIKSQHSQDYISAQSHLSEEEQLVQQKIFICNQNTIKEETLTAFQSRIFNQLQSVSKNVNIDLVELIKNWKSQNYEETYLQSFAQHGSKSNLKSKLDQLMQTIKFGKNWLQKKSYCQICTNPYTISQLQDSHYQMKCKHQFCKNCYTSYMLNCLQTGKKFLEFKCPQEGCQITAEYQDLTFFFSLKQVKTLINQAISDILNTHNSYSKCPSPNCDMVQRIADTNQLENAKQVNEKVQKSVYCSSCFQNYCNICKQQSHLPLTCEQFNQLEQSLQLDNTWIIKNTKNCPQCFSNIEKNQGCSHMKCLCCQYEFCWECLSKYSFSHECNIKDQVDNFKLISLQRQTYFQNYVKSSEFTFNLKSLISRCLYFQHQLSFDNEFENTFESVVEIIKAYKKLQTWSQIYSNQNLLLFISNKNEEKITDLMDQQDNIFKDIQQILKSLNLNFDRLSSNKFNNVDLKILIFQLNQMETQLLDTIKKACLLNSQNIQSPQLYCLP